MKAGDRFLFDCQNGRYTSFVLVETAGFWYLVNERDGRLWCSPENSLTPIDAFGGDSWHNRFRKLPRITFEWHTFDEGDSSFDCLYALHHDTGNEINVTITAGGATEKEYLLEYNHTYKFSDLETIH